MTKLAAAVSAAGQLNAIVFNVLKTSTKTVEGKVFVGGNVVGNLTVGAGDATKTERQSNWATLTVGGSISGSTTVKNGTNGSGKVSTAGSIVQGLARNYGVNVGGDAGTITFSDKTIGAAVMIGGSDSGTINTGVNSTVSIRGSANSLTTGAGSTINVGTDVKSFNGGANTVSRIGGNVGNAGAGTVTLGSGSTTYIGGQLQVNTLKNFTGNVYTNGVRYSGTTTAPAAYHFSQSNSFTAPASPAGAIADETAILLDELTYLAYGLSTLPSSQTLATLAALPIASYGNKSYVVFNVANGASFFKQSGSLSTLLQNMPSTVSVIINVNGDTISQTSTFGNISYAQDLIWNFYNATNLTLTNFQGTVLAPNATVTNSGTITGSVIASVFNQNGNVYLSSFQGNMNDALAAITVADPIGAVPEPSTWAMMLIGFGAIGLTLRRHGFVTPLFVQHRS